MTAPRPWTVRPSHDLGRDADYWHIEAGKNGRIRVAAVRGEANARLIVDAVNAYAAKETPKA